MIPLFAAAQTPPYTNTIVVGGAATPGVNGANLINAVIGIPAPGPANRWLVKLEPGIFDIGVLTLVLRDYVDVEGSGRGVTTITGLQATGATVIDFATMTVYGGAGSTVFAPAGVHSELRELTVENHCAGAGGTGIVLASGDARLSRVAVAVSTPVTAAGIAIGADSRLVEIEVQAECTWSAGIVTGVSIQDSSPSLEEVTISTAGAAAGLHRGLRAENSNARLVRLEVKAPLAANAAFYAEGVYLGNTTGTPFAPRVENSRIVAGASDTGSQAYGIYATGSQLQAEIRNTVAKATGADFAAGLVAVGGAVVHAACSSFDGATRPYANPSGTLFFGASQLIGTSPLDPNVTCGSSFDGAYAPLNGPC